MLKILSRAIGILLVLCLIVNPGLATAVSQQKLVECHAMSLSATTAFHDQAFALRSGVVPMAQWKWKPVVYVFSLTAAALGFASHARYFHVHIWPVILGAISTFPFVSWIEISLLGSGGLIAAFFSQDDPEKLHNMDVMKALPKAVEDRK